MFGYSVHIGQKCLILLTNTRNLFRDTDLVADSVLYGFLIKIFKMD